mmetsp:Transcript_5747/g.12950  ORF Transcript_5747/g.12950 Transcript_5747/m.12950 type:complete len:551 (-) Transcript_5747:383-2035(-)
MLARFSWLLTVGCLAAATLAADCSHGTDKETPGLIAKEEEDTKKDLLAVAHSGGNSNLFEYSNVDMHSGGNSNLFKYSNVDPPNERNKPTPSLAPSVFDEANFTSVDTHPLIRLGVPASHFGWVSLGGGGGGGGGHGGDDFGGGGMRRRSKIFQDDIRDDYDMNELLPHHVLLEFIGVPQNLPDSGWAQLLRQGDTILSPIRKFFRHVGNYLHSAWISLWQHSSEATHTTISPVNTPEPETEKMQVLYRDLYGRTRSVCLPSTSKVADLKCKIEEDTGVPAQLQLLSDGKHVLENDQSVSPYHNSNRIDLRLRIRGGAKSSIRVEMSSGELLPQVEDRDGTIIIAFGSQNSQFKKGDIIKSISSGPTTIELTHFNAASLSQLSNTAFLNTNRVFSVIRDGQAPSTPRSRQAMSGKPHPSNWAIQPSNQGRDHKRDAGSRLKSPHKPSRYSPPEKKRQGARSDDMTVSIDGALDFEMPASVNEGGGNIHDLVTNFSPMKLGEMSQESDSDMDLEELATLIEPNDLTGIDRNDSTGKCMLSTHCLPIARRLT